MDTLASTLFYSKALIEVPRMWSLLLINNSDFSLENIDL